MKKKIIGSLLFLIIIIDILIPTVSFGIEDNYELVNKIESEEQKNLINEDEEDYDNYTDEYKEWLKLSNEEKAKCEIIPRKYNVSLEEFLKDEIALQKSKKTKGLRSSSIQEEIPDSFDLRERIEVPVRNQGNLGLCWDFASMKSLETYLQLNEYGTFDLSELHLAYIDQPNLDKSGTSNGFGGSFIDFEDYVTGKWGPVLESEVPYDSQYSSDNFDNLLNLNKNIFVGDTINFPKLNKKNTNYTSEELNLFRNKVKNHIMKNGSLFAAISATENNGSDSIKYYNNHWVLNYQDTHYTDHAISIIGWDDNFSKENFPESNRPKEDGAYIAMNSWGEYWGERGIFYISYEDIYVESQLSGITNASTNKEEILDEIQFEDINLYNEIKNELGRKIYDYNDENLTLTTTKLAMKSIRKLYLDNKNISNLKGLEYCENFVLLDLSNNNIDNINLLENLNNEHMRIDLSNNMINDVSPLRNFYKIDVSGNQIEAGLETLNQAVILNVGNCSLTDIQIEQIINLPKIEQLSLKNNNIKNLDIFENLSSIESLNLSNNKEIYNLDKLGYVKELILQDCNFDNSIVNELKKLKNLNNLDLSYNNITQTNIFENFYNLQSLNLSYTNISDVSRIGYIRNLNLSGNKNLINLDTLYGVNNLILTDCNLKDFSFLDNLYSLREIDLSSNELITIPNFSNSRCSNIILNHNKIKDISEIENLMNSDLSVTTLYMSDNLIEQTPTFLNSKLYISFDNNYISEITDNNRMAYTNQRLSGNYDVEINKDNRIPLPQILQKACQSIYGFKLEFITENCIIDYKNGEVIINPDKIGEGKARVTLKNSYTYPMCQGTTFDIYYKSYAKLDNIKVVNEPSKQSYRVGQNFDPYLMKVKATYNNGESREVTDYTILDGDDLTQDKKEITISYEENGITKTTTQPINVYTEDKLVNVTFPDTNLYNEIKTGYALQDNPRQVRKNLIVDYNDENNTVQMVKDTLETVDNLLLMQKDITNLTGIKYFTGLRSIDLSFNTNLKTVNELLQLDKLKIVDIHVTGVEDVKDLINKENIEQIILRKHEQNIINSTIEEIELPEFIYQAVTEEEGVTAKANIYYDTFSPEDGEYYTKIDGEKEETEIIIDRENKKAIARLNRQVTSEHDEGIRGLEVKIEGGKCNGALYIAFYNNIEEIKVEKAPDRTHYIVGQSFDRAGMKLMATYRDRSVSEINNYTVLDGDNLQEGQNFVTMSYMENGLTKTTTQEITVRNEEDEKIINDDSNYYTDETKILGISPDTSISEFKNNFNETYRIVVTKNNSEVTEGAIGTGMEIQVLENDEEKARFTAIVAADVNKDGKIDVKDMIRINNYRLYNTNLVN